MTAIVGVVFDVSNKHDNSNNGMPRWLARLLNRAVVSSYMLRLAAAIKPPTAIGQVLEDVLLSISTASSLTGAYAAISLTLTYFPAHSHSRSLFSIVFIGKLSWKKIRDLLFRVKTTSKLQDNF